MLALSTFLFRLLCVILQFDTVKEADQDSLRSWRPPIIQLRGIPGGESCVYLQPVIVGDNVILSTGALKEPFQWISWNARSPTDNSTTHTNWVFLGGLNSTKHPHVNNPEKYAIDWRGFLFIRNVSNTQNGTEFMATIRKEDDFQPEVSFVKLFVMAEKALPSTTRSPVTSQTETPCQPSTGSTKSSADDFGEGIVVGVIVGLILGVIVAFAFLKFCRRGRCTCNPGGPEEQSSSPTSLSDADTGD